MSKLKKYLIVATVSFLSVSGLFYVVNNYNSDYLNKRLANVFSVEKALAVQAGCTQGPCIQTIDPPPYCNGYNDPPPYCTGWNDPPPYCSSTGCTSYGCTRTGCTSYGCVARDRRGGCVAYGCTGYGCTGYGCTGYGCTGYTDPPPYCTGWVDPPQYCTGYTDPGPYCSAYGPDICPVSGSCGPAINSCNVGPLVDIADNSTYFLWQCQGKDGGSTANCSYPKNPVCSTVNSCILGNFLDLTDNAINYLWKCVNGFLSVNCSTPQATVSTIIPTNISATSVTLKGVIDTHGTTNLYYKFCLNDNWWCTSSWSVPSSTSINNLSVGINSLSAGTTYFYTLVVMTSSGATLTTSNATSFTTWNTFSVIKTGSGSGTVTAGGINCGSTCSASHPPGTIVFPQVIPASGSVFTGWKSVEQGGDCPSTALCPIRMSNKNITATANFESSKTLTVNKIKDAGTVTSGPTGINCGVSCITTSKSHLHNTKVILKAFPSTSYNFSNWSGCDSSSGNSCTVSVNSNKTITANFTLKNKFKLNITKSGKGTGYVTISKTGLSDIKCDFNNTRTSSCAGKYANDGAITLKAFPDSGSEFAGWGGVCVGKSNCSISQMDSDKNVTAYFNKI